MVRPRKYGINPKRTTVKDFLDQQDDDALYDVLRMLQQQPSPRSKRRMKERIEKIQNAETRKRVQERLDEKW